MWKDVNLGELVGASWNYKHDFDDPDVRQRMKKLEQNINKNGVVCNLLVRKMETGLYEVLDGNHRLKVMQKLDVKTAHVFDLGIIEDEEAKRISLEINENIFKADPLKLSNILSDLSAKYEIEDLATTLPYNPYELKSYIEMTTYDFDSETPPKEEKPKKEADLSEREDFSTIAVPASLVTLFEDQMQRARELVTQATGQKLDKSNTVMPFEIMVSVFSQIRDEDIVSFINGKL